MSERHESGGEVDVLCKGQHVLSSAARAKTAFSCSIVPHSVETFTLCLSLRDDYDVIK